MYLIKINIDNYLIETLYTYLIRITPLIEFLNKKV